MEKVINNIEGRFLYGNVQKLNHTKELWTKHKLDCISIDGIIELYKTAGKLQNEDL
tara:strand:+ start:361 stop:528 length:168 start_codon:yes stop_codon:yes gene_type:complete